MSVRNLSFVLLFSVASFAQQTNDEFFEKKVRPLFAKSCAGCHNAKMKAGGFDLTSVEGIAHEGLFEKGKPEASLLMKVLSYESRIKMPPSGKLPETELSDLRTWIAAGAPMPAVKSAQGTGSGTRKHGRGITDEEKSFWAFRPMTKPEPPVVRNEAWAQKPVDRFILSKLEQKGLAPAKPADKATLLRRVTFNLTGLPPTEQELRDFLADKSPNALEKVVDRLLASPRYGEHWGRHWLDVARYADSTGNDEDHRYPYAYRYRDYVIESMNQDVPFDRFIQEQIAGDLMPAPAGQKVNTRGIVATGFLALGAKAVAQQDKKKMLVDIYDEQIDTVSKGVLGLTLSCARCHDHKFDPLQTRDYYSWMSIFAATKNFNNPDTHVSGLLYTPLVPKEEYDLYLESKKISDKKRNEIANAVELQTIAYTAQVGQSVAKYMLAARRVMGGKPAGDATLNPLLLEKWVEFLKEGKERRAYMKDWFTANDATAPEIAAKYQARYVKMQASWAEAMERTRASRRSGKDVMPPRIYADDDQFFFDVHYSGPHSVPAKDRAKLWPADKIAPVAKLEKELEDLKKQLPQEPPMACAVADHPAGEGGVTFGKVYVRGDYNTFGEDAPPSVPQVLSEYAPPQFQPGRSGRLELAQWLTRPDNPLTARVFVNRVWYWHFGEGIVRTPDNFGKMGARPSHPELLDYLAQRFISEGWSLKKLQKEIVLSSFYQMSSIPTDQQVSADPENTLLSRYPRRRLTVEELRDGMLWLDQSLDTTMGGSLQSGFGTDGENSNDRLSMKPEAIKRRTVYVPLRRANLPALLNLFDFGDATTTASQRTSTIIAPQALFLMNSEFVEDRAKALAKQAAEKANSDADRMRTLYVRILGREASGAEVDDALSYLNKFRDKFPKRTADDAWMSLSRILLASNEYIYLD
ncbi:hypothetical protein F183_A53320 [Bryobacterales bacterium F-183]|nr:hypothetical protein F183_A53320 [Bryobacterales bacterium F-183]